MAADMRTRVHMAHVPNRATQHGLFRTNAETPTTSLKPGQQELRGNTVYAQEAKPHRETYITQDQTKETIYTSSLAKSMLSEDYVEPVKPFKPTSTLVEGLNSGTAHWCSEYKATSRVEGPPTRSMPMRRKEGEQMGTVGRAAEQSSYMQEFGKLGSDPRDHIVPGLGKLPVLRHALNNGTTKGTQHLPGYQGYIPYQVNTTEAARGADGAGERKVDKTNAAQTFHVNLVGYSGHVPESARNDRGGRRLTDLTTAGKDFMTPRTARFQQGVQSLEKELHSVRKVSKDGGLN